MLFEKNVNNIPAVLAMLIFLSVVAGVGNVRAQEITQGECLSIGGDYDIDTNSCTTSVEASEEDCLAMVNEYTLENGECIKYGFGSAVLDTEKCLSAGGVIHSEYGCIPEE